MKGVDDCEGINEEKGGVEEGLSDGEGAWRGRLVSALCLESRHHFSR